MLSNISLSQPSHSIQFSFCLGRKTRWFEIVRWKQYSMRALYKCKMSVNKYGPGIAADFTGRYVIKSKLGVIVYTRQLPL